MNNKLKEIREQKGISQEELSKISGISRTTISELENQKKQVTTNTTLEKLADALEMKIADIFFTD